MNTNQLSTIPSQQGVTTPFSTPWLNTLRREMITVGSKTELAGGRGLTPTEKQQITATLSNCRQQIIGGENDRRAVAGELARLLAAFPAAKGSDDSVALRVDAYVTVIDTAPVWVVAKAVKDFLSGKVPGASNAFAPTPPQFATHMRSILEPYEREIIALERLNTVEVETEQTPEERAKVSAQMDKLREELRAGSGPSQQSEAVAAQEAEKWLREKAAELGTDFDSVKDAPKGDSRMKRVGEG